MTDQDPPTGTSDAVVGAADLSAEAETEIVFTYEEERPLLTWYMLVVRDVKVDGWWPLGRLWARLRGKRVTAYMEANEPWTPDQLARNVFEAMTREVSPEIWIRVETGDTSDLAATMGDSTTEEN